MFCTTHTNIEATLHGCCLEMLSANCPLLTTCNRMTGKMMNDEDDDFHDDTQAMCDSRSDYVYKKEKE